MGSQQRVKIPAFYSKIKLQNFTKLSNTFSKTPSLSFLRLRTAKAPSERYKSVSIQKLRKAGSTQNWQNRKGTETLCFASNLQQFCNISETFLQPVCVFRNSTESPRRTVKIKRFLFRCNCHYLRTGLSTARPFRSLLRTVDLSTQKWGTALTCKLIFFVDSMFDSLKSPSFIYIYFRREGYKANRSHTYVFFFFFFSFIFLEAPHDELTL